MLRAVPMVHLRVQVANRDAATVTRCIAREGVLHLIDLAHGRIAGMGPPERALDHLAAFRDLAHRARQMAQRIGVALPDPRGRLSGEELDFEEERAQLESTLRPIEHRIDEAWRALQSAREKATHARESLELAARLTRAGVDPVRLARLRLASVRLAAGDEEAFEPLSGLISPAPFAVVPLEREGASRLAAICVPSSASARLESALRLSSLQALPVAPRPEAQLQAELREAAAAEDSARETLAAEKTLALPVLADVVPRADVAVLLLQAETLFASSGRFTVLSGWVPERDSDKLRRALVAATGGRAVIDLERPEDLPEVALGALKVPILHRNPLLLRPFQALIRIYGTPSYQEVEPTAFFAISFLLMFGLMFGDVGHGAVLFAAGLLTFRRMPRFLDYGILLMEGGVFSMAFGALYGSVFGVEDLLPALWMRPLHDLPRFMTVAAGAGAVLVSLGLLLNVVNLWRSGKRSAAIFSIEGLSGAFLYWVLLGLLVRKLMPSTWVLPLWAPLALAGLAVLLLLLRPAIVRRLEGPKRKAPAHATSRGLVALEASIELVDAIFTFFANTVSFVRIAAFAAVHAGLFVAIFAMADTLAHVRFGGVFSAAVLFAGNAVAILLEGLTVSVQVLRLEYYEFFTRFFHGGGEPYQPLMLRSGTKEGSP